MSPDPWHLPARGAGRCQGCSARIETGDTGPPRQRRVGAASCAYTYTLMLHGNHRWRAMGMACRGAARRPAQVVTGDCCGAWGRASAPSSAPRRRSDGLDDTEGPARTADPRSDRRQAIVHRNHAEAWHAADRPYKLCPDRDKVCCRAGGREAVLSPAADAAEQGRQAQTRLPWLARGSR